MIFLYPDSVLAQFVFLWVLPGYHHLHSSNSRLRSLKKKFTCSAGDEVDACRNKEVTGASFTGYDTLLQAYPVISPLWFLYPVFQCSLFQWESQLSDFVWIWTRTASLLLESKWKLKKVEKKSTDSSPYLEHRIL